MDSKEWQKCWMVSNAGKYETKAKMIDAQIRAAMEAGIKFIQFNSELCAVAADVSIGLGFSPQILQGGREICMLDLTKNRKDPKFVSRVLAPVPIPQQTPNVSAVKLPAVVVPLAQVPSAPQPPPAPANNDAFLISTEVTGEGETAHFDVSEIGKSAARDWTIACALRDTLVNAKDRGVVWVDFPQRAHGCLQQACELCSGTCVEAPQRRGFMRVHMSSMRPPPVWALRSYETGAEQQPPPQHAPASMFRVSPVPGQTVNFILGQSELGTPPSTMALYVKGIIEKILGAITENVPWLDFHRSVLEPLREACKCLACSCAMSPLGQDFFRVYMSHVNIPSEIQGRVVYAPLTEGARISKILADKQGMVTYFLNRLSPAASSPPPTPLAVAPGAAAATTVSNGGGWANVPYFSSDSRYSLSATSPPPLPPPPPADVSRSRVISPVMSGGWLCMVCLDNAKNTACVPCGHSCMCATCADLLDKTTEFKCPVCHVDLAFVLRLHN